RIIDHRVPDHQAGARVDGRGALRGSLLLHWLRTRKQFHCSQTIRPPVRAAVHSRRHSLRRAIIGSTAVARRAGSQLATSAPIASRAAMPPITMGSAGLTWYNMRDSTRERASAPSPPSAALHAL